MIWILLFALLYATLGFIVGYVAALLQTDPGDAEPIHDDTGRVIGAARTGRHP